jgi:hypothetical protein
MRRSCTAAWGQGPEGRRWDAGESFRIAAACSLVAAICGLLLFCAPALAATGHPFLRSLSEAPLGTALKEPGAVAVDHATGEVFVGESASGVVDVFSAAGSYVAQFGEGLEPEAVAVDEASGDVYVAEPFGDAVLVYKPTGSGGYELLSEWFGTGAPGQEFGAVAGVAVDEGTGEVYVVDSESLSTESGVVDIFKPRPAGPEEAQEGEYLRTLTDVPLDEPNGVAVDAGAGEVYIAASSKGEVYVFSTAGALEAKLKGAGSPQGSFRGPEGEEGNVAAIAVDEATGDLLVAEAERHVVSEFNQAGEWVGWLTGPGSGRFGEPRGVATDSSGDIYVADAGAQLVDVFGPGVVVPDVATKSASKATRTTAVLNGVGNGDGDPAQYRFEWGTSEAYGFSTPVTASGSGEEEITAALTGLTAGTTYYYRVVGENANGTNVGAGREFTTRPAVEDLSSGAVAELTPTGVTLTGSLTPGGVEAHYFFEWGLSTKYGETSPMAPGIDAGTGTEPVDAETLLSELTPNTTYHYRLVGTNSFGTTLGQDRTFTTSGPPRITSEPTTGITHDEATINAKIDPDELATTYRFEYGETTSYGHEVPIGGASIGSGAEPVKVVAVLQELEPGIKLRPGITYHFRVVASNAAETVDGPDRTFTTVPPALIDSESVAHVSATGAELQTAINPLGNDTTYDFQYGTESCEATPSPCTSAPNAPVDIGSGESDVSGDAQLQELQPGTTYYYRVLATNSLGTADGVQHVFTTQQSGNAFALPDGRSWEMVSPPDKDGAPIEALTREGGLILASDDGDSLAYVADGPIAQEAQGNRSPEMQQILATRGPDGWSSQDIVTPNSQAEGIPPGIPPEYQFFSPDLSLALVEPWGDSARAEPPLAPEATQKTIYVRNNATGTYLPLVTEANVAPGTEFGHDLHFISATPDLSHIIIESKVALTGPGSAPGLYEWAGGVLQFVSMLPEGAPAHEVALGYSHVATNAISSDGLRVVWTNSVENPGHLYMRDTATSETVQLDAAQGVPEPGGLGEAQFQTANSEGSRVFFTDKQRLTSDSTADTEPGKEHADLYECEMIEENGKLRCHLKDLTVDANAGEHAAVQGFLFGSSQDGTTLYVVGQGVLATNENGNGESAEAGRDNLYELHAAGTGWVTTFIGVLANEDSPEWEGNRKANSAFLTARVSPNGRFLAFMSAASITGYDNVDQNSGKRDEEVYLYDSASAGLRCVSCDPTGARPVGVLDTEEAGEGLGLLVDRRKVWLGHWLAGNIPGWTAQALVSALYQSRYLSDEGRLFFNSPDDLVPQASNGKEDVYEYEPSGVGSCESASGGCVALISSGSSGKESAFLEATPSGDDVFFITAAQLLPQDTDTAFDIYDARVCTQGSPCLTPLPQAPTGCSTADACRPAAPAQQAPIGPSGTATVSGSGNAQPSSPKQEVKGVKTSSKPLTRAQKLAGALKVCKRMRSRKKRHACELHAKKLYGPKTTKTPTAKQLSSGRLTKRSAR